MAIALVLACGFASAARHNDDEARKLALTQTQSSDADVRLAAIAVLAEIGKPVDLPLLQSRLFDEDGRIRGTAEAAIWAIWSRSGDAATDRVFERGLEQMREGQLRMAVDTFAKVIAMRPEFAEAWNKRATVYFLLGEDELSLKDCDEVLKRNPQHFGVLAGYGQIYLRNGDLERALDMFERALAINPNMTGVQASIDALRETLVKRGRRFI
ncbi:MAG: tetratricopeptide repeat protein [Prolixibacteraceae bacterium]|nr:tetratricopeptide repeat protein [Burkholderiales bacterium]